MKIFKYPINLTDEQFVTMREGAQILTVAWQRGQLCLWAKVNENLDLECRIIRIFGTGHEMGPTYGLNYIGTVQQNDGHLVWHVFEDKGWQAETKEGNNK